MESRIARGAGLKFCAISAGKMRRFVDRGLLQKLSDLPTAVLNARDIFRVIKGFKQSRRILQDFDPDVIFIKGGYVGLPVGLAARSLGLPFVIHESDMRPGLTNRILSKYATRVAVGFPPDLYKGWQQEKLIYTGNPIRKEILASHRLEGLAKFKLDSSLPVILIICGSQGSQAINKVILDGLSELTRHYQLIHVTGEKNIEEVRFKVGRISLDFPERYQPYSFLTDTLGMALAVADLVIGRGGANSFSELAALSKPAIIIPHPGLDDQTLNATTLARAGAIKVIPQDRLATSSLIGQIEQILSSDKEQGILAKAISKYAKRDAALALAEVIMAARRVRTKAEHKDQSDGNQT
jgi:UDP-N-acetylglucosamine--N-acetylmuramyl-(pentapeptide) pyrophosphoryl-undecaprenol N-acetylglucosamine transferase